MCDVCATRELRCSLAQAFYEGTTLNGRPHGFGSWIDRFGERASQTPRLTTRSAAGGEVLSGWFERGVPIGPFDSVEVR